MHLRPHSFTHLRSSAAIIAGLMLLTLLMRLPVLYHAVHDWDESTFLVMGADILKGHLPYTTLWDIKPPLLYGLFSLLILGGKTISGVRLLGDCYMVASAMALYFTLRRRNMAKAGLWAAVIFLVYSNAITRAIMSENLACLPLMFVLLICTKQNLRVRDYARMGLLVALAGLIRTNMFLLLPGVCAIAMSQNGSAKDKINRCMAATTAASLPLAILVIIYADHLPILWASLVEAPLYYSRYYNQAHGLWHRFFDLFNDSVLNPRFVFMWLLVVAGVVYSIRHYPAHRDFLIRMAALFVFTLISVFFTGYGAAHYLIQLMPFCGLFGGIMLMVITGKSKKPKLCMIALAIAIMAGPLPELLSAYKDFPASLAWQKNRPIYEVANTLKKARVQGKYIYACNMPIMYFLTEAQVPYYVLHPFNYSIGYFNTGLKQYAPKAVNDMDNMLDKKPAYIVYHKGEANCEYSDTSGNTTAQLEAEYELPRIIGYIALRKRKDYNPEN